MGAWTLDDIPWEHFDREKLDPELAALAKAASLVEANGGAYAEHLCRIFADDSEFQADARRWGDEEIQHGNALGRWAALADPDFDFAASFHRFRAGFRIDFARSTSRRGSRTGEMVARCMVEIGTSSYYAALSEAAREPVLKAICRRIAADEIRHYKLFYKTLRRYAERDRKGLLSRLAIALGRLAEVQDDELAYAYHAANDRTLPYNRRRCGQAYARLASKVYRRHHVKHAVVMTLKAVGLPPNGRLAAAASGLLWRAMRHRAQRLEKRGV